MFIVERTRELSITVGFGLSSEKSKDENNNHFIYLFRFFFFILNIFDSFKCFIHTFIHKEIKVCDKLNLITFPIRF